MNLFMELGIQPEVLRSLSELRFVEPTPIQRKVIPLLLQNRTDLVALAQTGTGKTAAFGIPLLQNIDGVSRHPQALILCPTRELCVQVARELQSMAKYLAKVTIVPIYGGAGIEGQITALRRGAHIIVATPGRLQDLLKRGRVNLTGIATVVLDEADEMLQMGFQEEIDAILAETPTDKNILLFSATMPRTVAGIAAKYMRHPLEITVGQKNSGTENVVHMYCVAKVSERYAALKRLVDLHPELYAIIFCRTRQETGEIADRLQQDGYNAEAIHGDLSQAQRDQVMERFRRKNANLLVATDVAARGLDVNNLSHVINYSLPDESAVYTHRSGRTGRAGKSGTAISIIQPREKIRISAIEKQLHRKFEQIPVPCGPEICNRQFVHLLDTLQKEEIDRELEPLLASMQEKLAEFDRDDLIRRLLAKQFNRLLGYYRNAPDLNVAMDSKPKTAGGKRNYKDKGAGRPFIRLQLNVGKKDGIHAGRLIGEINECTVGPKIRIGRIDIADNSAVFEAESRFAPQVIDAFASRIINGKPVHVTVAERKVAASFVRKRTGSKRIGGYRKAGKAKIARNYSVSG